MNSDSSTYLFLVSKYPNISETFIYDQVETLRNHGFKVHVISNRTPGNSEIHPYMSQDANNTIYLDSQSLPVVLYAQLYCLLNYPTKYFHSILKIIFSDYYSGKKKKSLLHLVGAALLAYNFRLHYKIRIHAHFAYAGLSVAYWLSQLLGCDYSVTVHGSDILLTTDLKEKELLAADCIISISQYNKKHLLKQLPKLDKKKIKVIPLGIDTNEFYHKKTGQKNKEFIILNIGRLITAKGQIYLIRACKILSEKGILYKCYIAGIGPLKEYLKEEIIRLGLSDSVNLLGRVYHEEVIDLFNRSDLFVLPSVSEGIPVVLMEALAMEVPVIASDITGIPEIVNNGENGLLVVPKDPEIIAGAIMRLYSDKTFRKTIANNGRVKVKDDFHLVKNTLKFAATIGLVKE